MSILSLTTHVFTFTRFCPKRLTVSTFVTRKKPQRITVDRVKETTQKQCSSPRLSIEAALVHVCVDQVSGSVVPAINWRGTHK